LVLGRPVLGLMQPKQASSSMALTTGLLTRTVGLLAQDEKGLADTAVVADMSAMAAAMMIFFTGSLLSKTEERCCPDKETGEGRFYSFRA
jgi:hypothetical protein